MEVDTKVSMFVYNLQRMLCILYMKLLLYGIEESLHNTNKQQRMKHDLENTLSSLSKAGNEIKADDIKDAYRLGKYVQQSTRPRPLLVKFLRSSTVLDVLKNKTRLEAPVFIKPDLTLEERQKESLLLKERRSLIEKGTQRKNIKIKNYSIFVNDKLHCKVQANGKMLEFPPEPLQEKDLDAPVRMEIPPSN